MAYGEWNPGPRNATMDSPRHSLVMAKYKPLSDDPFKVYAKVEYSPSGPSSFGDELRASTADLSSSLDFGENSGHGVFEIDPGDPANMLVDIALEWTQAPWSFCLNDFARPNMESMLATLDTSHLERSWSNDLAAKNMEPMSFTLDTSHFDISALKEEARANMLFISVIRDTSHFPIGPYALLGQ